MKQEEKQLLLQDLCARLPYGVKIMFSSNGFRWDWEQTLEEISQCEDGEYAINGWGIHGIKPYLRPMSSMTEEEIIEFNNIPSTKNYTIIKDDLPWDVANYKQIDWLNAHHLDFRNLIERGLAIDCTNLNIYKNGRKDKNA